MWCFELHSRHSFSVRRDRCTGRKGCQMIGRSAQEETVIRLFAAYSRQGIKKQKSIMLIAATLGIFQKNVLEILQKEKSVD